MLKRSSLASAALALSMLSLTGCTMIRKDAPPADVKLQAEIKALEGEYLTRGRAIFTCSHWRDSNRNGLHDFPTEFMGIKKRFLENEDMLLVAIVNGAGLKGKIWTIKIYGPDDREIENCGAVLPSDQAAITLGSGRDENLAGWLSALGGTGDYTALFYLGDHLESMHKFRLFTAEKGTAGGHHTVQHGETLSSIARRFNTSVKELIRMNGIRNPNRLFVGQQILVPAPKIPAYQPTVRSTTAQ